MNSLAEQVRYEKRCQLRFRFVVVIANRTCDSLSSWPIRYCLRCASSCVCIASTISCVAPSFDVIRWLMNADRLAIGRRDANTGRSEAGVIRARRRRRTRRIRPRRTRLSLSLSLFVRFVAVRHMCIRVVVTCSFSLRLCSCWTMCATPSKRWLLICRCVPVAICSTGCLLSLHVFFFSFSTFLLHSLPRFVCAFFLRAGLFDAMPIFYMLDRPVRFFFFFFAFSFDSAEENHCIESKRRCENAQESILASENFAGQKRKNFSC
jgi:hypothetical protein